MSIAYRPEIDGLRCVAVMIVIFNHLGVPGFGGGYVGVDVFFVISGYLITEIIKSEKQIGAFSISSFYRRRIIRLAPAYFTVLFFTGLLSAIIMLPAELEQFSESALFSTFFAANFYMWHAVGGYFGTGADTTPLLHLWSLAVEEQFYLVWPASLLVLMHFLGAKGRLLGVILVLLLLALAVSEYGAIHYRAAAYYLMPARAFELLIGAALAFSAESIYRWFPRPIQVLGGCLGLCLVVYACLSFSGATWFPGLHALVPCLGTALIIIFVRQDDPLLGRVLASRVFVGVGKISYPAYLWHWPLIAFLNLCLIEINLFVGAAVVVATMLLSAATYVGIEKPARRFRNSGIGKVAVTGFVMPAMLSVLFCLSVFFFNGFPSRFDEALNQKAAAVLAHADLERGRCNEGPVAAPLGPDQCILGKKKQGVDILLVGDSHANHFSGMIDVLASKAGLRAYDITQSNTAFMVGVDRYYERDGEIVKHGNFRTRNEVLRNDIIPKGYDYVVMAGSYVGYYKGLLSDGGNAPSHAETPAVMKAAMLATVQAVIESGAVPIIVKGAPTFDRNVSRCTLNNLRFGKNEECNLPRKEYEEKFAGWSALLDSLTEEFDSLVVIDPAKVMCDQSWCYSELDGLPLYKDSNHLNYKGSMLIGEIYASEVGNPFRHD
ncbi:acyltransferase family protein [Alloalcanivorax gelatiniphagus]|uniref:Acyltransferase n=1 Tax=Alloalcanivorax gelatiniphagus TaxID=1194167 RepID=A0ABY2XMM6_9GAMM|nr:acyltransferase family protein [Alloalcanivorax gelatiniphagus]TMW13622.1 acyltransferase [Alloalcanivorax gelatiniphagus]